MKRAAVVVVALASAGIACSSSTSPPGADTACAGACPQSKIKHVIVLIQENHTFDDHFGGYCKAAPGSNPTCTTGPSCCEAMPAADPTGVKPVVLTDDVMGAFDPNHEAACEAAEMSGGKMDGYATAPDVGGSPCGAPGNVAMADPATIAPLWALAATGGLADRYFQPVVGESYANDMFFARAQYVFGDDQEAPAGAVGFNCGLESMPATLTGETLGDLLTGAGVPWAFFAEGYAAMKAAGGGCPPKPAACAFPFAFDPCGFEPSDVPFEYYASTRDSPATMKDYGVLEGILQGGSGELPAVSFVKAYEFLSEHPGTLDKLSAGVAFVASLARSVASSRFAGDTLLLVTYDEGGGYFDHVAPPPPSPVDGMPYGTRVPLLAVGPFVKKGVVSHATLEHSSIVKLIEWNFLGGKTGQLHGRDAVVGNLGSLLDPSATGARVPD